VRRNIFNRGILFSLLKPQKPKKTQTISLYSNPVQAGFPSPADDYIEDDLDIYKHLIDKPEATFFARAKGDSMKDVGIFDKDILVVDRSKNPRNNEIVVACVDNEFTVKRYNKKGGRIRLMPENSDFDPIEFKEGSEAYLWGVVTFVIHRPK
jgi:DNA polymerase V